MPAANLYHGECNACHKPVAKRAGYVEFKQTGRGRRGGHYIVWCKACYNASDNSGDEDRACGDRAYEDACARACGY